MGEKENWANGYTGLIADSVRACGRVFAEVKRMRSVGMNGDVKKSS